MRFDFKKEVSSLKRLDRDELYRTFHQIQFDVLHPQWEAHFRKLMGDHVNFLALYGPRSPQVPQNYSAEIFEQISNASGRELLLLNHVVGYLDEPMRSFRLARDLGIKTVVVHDIPNDETFKYEFSPEEVQFKSRKVSSERHRNQHVHHIAQNAVNAGWNLLSDTRLDFIYATDSQKLSLAKMELGLDLIEHHFAGRPSHFDDLTQELEKWFQAPQSKLVVKGCSRWLVFQ